MKTKQKFEIFFGAATLLAALLRFYLIDFPQMEELEKLGHSNARFLVSEFLLLILPAFLVFIGAYVHAEKRSIVGLILIFVFGGWTAFMNAVGFLIGSSPFGYPLVSISPGVFTFATMLLALYSAIISLTQSETKKFR